MFKSDQPIRSHREDILGRSSFAQSLGAAILSYREKDSIALGLYGAWGSGKTSIINMALEYIDSTCKNSADEEKPIILIFNPWNYSDQNQLITQFFKQLSIALRHTNYASDVKSAGERLETYAKIFEPFTFVPIIGTLAGPASKILRTAGDAAKSWADLKSSDLNALRAELNELLEKQPHRIIIVIDDIDRLNNTEIRQTFQLIKSLGDFPNTTYLVAFDKNVVIRALEEVQKSSGEEYLEKVIQVPFEVPLISKQEVEHLLLDQIGTLVKDILEDEWDQTYWGNIYHSGLKYFFRTIRDVTRYINSLRFSFEMVKGEVNPIDFLAITAIQVFIPRVYYGIRDNKDIFSGAFDFSSRLDDERKEQAKKRCDEILSRVKEPPKKILKNFLSRLFPKLETLYGNTSYTSDGLIDWRKNCRICSPDIFDNFFRLSIPKGEISHEEIKTILSLGNNLDAFAEALLGLNKDGRITRFLERLGDYTESGIPEKNVEPIITVLMDIGDLFPQDESYYFGTDNRWRITGLCYQLSHRFSTHEKRFTILRNAIKKGTRSLYTIVHEVSVLGGEHGKYTSKKNLKPEEERTVDASRLEKLEKLALQKIRIWAEDRRLAKHRDLAYILFRWRDWAKKAEPLQFVNKMMEKDGGLIDFITGFLSKSTSQGVSDYVRRIHWRIDKSIEKFVDLKKLSQRIKGISSASNFRQLDDRKKLAIKTALDTINGKIKNDF